MRIAITSNFPTTTTPEVVEMMRYAGNDPRIAWIPPLTTSGRQNFPKAQRRFRELGFSHVEYCDIDEAPDQAQLARLQEYEIVYLTGGDPLEFRRRLVKDDVASSLMRCIEHGCMFVGASAGAMQFTKAVSLSRLRTATVNVVVDDLEENAGLALVDYEILPHLNRHGLEFLDRVSDYSTRVPYDVFALADGAALLHTRNGAFRWAGHVARIRSGVMEPLAAWDEQGDTPPDRPASKRRTSH